jgi:hypothetical protein
MAVLNEEGNLVNKFEEKAKQEDAHRTLAFQEDQ